MTPAQIHLSHAGLGVRLRPKPSAASSRRRSVTDRLTGIAVRGTVATRQWFVSALVAWAGDCAD